MRSQLQHEREVSRDLREELSRAKNDSMQLVGTKVGRGGHCVQCVYGWGSGLEYVFDNFSPKEHLEQRI